MNSKTSKKIRRASRILASEMPERNLFAISGKNTTTAINAKNSKRGVYRHIKKQLQQAA